MKNLFLFIMLLLIIGFVVFIYLYQKKENLRIYSANKTPYCYPSKFDHCVGG
jgi:hypothetical protein